MPHIEQSVASPVPAPERGTDMHTQSPYLSPNEKVALDELAAEGVHKTPAGRAFIEAEVAQFAVELAIDAVLRGGDADIRAARASLARGRASAGETVPHASEVTMIAGSEVGWIANDGPVSVVVERQERQNKTGGYWFGSIIDKNYATQRAFASLEVDGRAEAIMDQLQQSDIPRYLQSGEAAKGQKKPDTIYPTADIAIEGTDQRAILLLPSKREEAGRQESVAIVAAIYDQADTHGAARAVRNLPEAA